MVFFLFQSFSSRYYLKIIILEGRKRIKIFDCKKFSQNVLNLSFRSYMIYTIIFNINIILNKPARLEIVKVKEL